MLLKNLYNDTFFEGFLNSVGKVYPQFDKKAFLSAVYDAGWESRELKQRMRHITQVLGKMLPARYPDALQIIFKIIAQLQQDRFTGKSIEFLFFPDFVEIYGLNDYQHSVAAIEYITPFCSAEFAVRPFIEKYPEAMMQQMLAWSQHENHHVRRLASEGCRPRLPWGKVLPQLKKDPAPILPVLENLKDDPSEYVRRSVANNLNDIAKDHPAVVLQLAQQWKGQSAQTDWMIKHACRTLLKKAHPEALQHFDLGTAHKVSIRNLKLSQQEVTHGDKLIFSFQLDVEESSSVKLRIEYGIDYRKANGKTSRKIFQLSSKTFDGGSSITFARSQHFKDLTTRRHYAGLHHIVILVNGQEKASADFVLKK